MVSFTDMFSKKCTHLIALVLCVAWLSQVQGYSNLGLDVFERTLHSVARQDFDGDSFSFRDATRYTLDHLSTPDITAPHLTCVQYAHGKSFLDAVTEELGSDFIQMVSNDPKNYACLLINCSEEQLEKILLKEECETWQCAAGILPANLKISPSLISFDASNSSDKAHEAPEHFMHRGSEEKSHHLHYRGLSINISPPGKKSLSQKKYQGPSGISVLLSPGSAPSFDNRKLAESKGFDSMLDSWKHEWTKLEGSDAIRALSWHSDIMSHKLHHSKPGRSTKILEQVESVTDLMETLARMTEEESLEDSSKSKNVARFCKWDKLDISHVGSGIVHIQTNKLLSGKNDKRDTACVVGFLGFLASRGDVMHLTPLRHISPSNYVGASIVQSGLETSESELAHPLWNRGLKGLGQIIGISDTGLDDSSCFFRDDVNGPTPRGTWPADEGVIYPEQRKVIQYLQAPGSDGVDYYRGHGTHVSGTVIGSRMTGDAGLPACSTDTLQTCTGECLSDADCHQLGLLTPCLENISDDLFNRLFYCPAYDCDGDFTEAPGTYEMPTECGPDTSDLLALAEGVAPEAKIAFFDGATKYWFLESVTTIDMLESLMAAGADISSHSWGLDYSWLYTTYDYDVDTFLYTNPNALTLFAAGNSGYWGTYTVLSPALSKNTLTIGSSGSTTAMFGPGSQYVSNFSSRGPTFDKRIKPDVVAPGEHLLSAAGRGKGPQGEEDSGLPSCAATYFRGTSMATPLVAGHVLLIREYFETGLYAEDLTAAGLCDGGSYYMCDMFVPTGALLKAVVINSAVHINATYERTDPVDDAIQATYEGFGRAQFDTVLPLAETGPMLFTLESYVTAWEAVMVQSEFVPERASEGFKVTLAWMDPPVAIPASKALLHDLSLTVIVFYEGEYPSSWYGSGYSSSTYYSGRNSGYYSSSTYFPPSYSFYYSSTMFGGIFNTSSNSEVLDSLSHSSSSFSSSYPALPYRYYNGNHRTIGMREVGVDFEGYQDLRDDVNTVEQVELTAEDLVDAVSIYIHVGCGQLYSSRQTFALAMTGAAEVSKVSRAYNYYFYGSSSY